MPSSPADPALPTTDQVLAALTRAYDEALVAAASADFAAVGELLTAADRLLAAPTQPPADASVVGPLQDAARAAHARLQAVLAELRAETLDELGRTRHGRRALGAYAGERDHGRRVESRA